MLRKESLRKEEYNTERRMLGERKDRVEEAWSPGEKVGSHPKDLPPNSPGFAQSLNREKKKGYVLSWGEPSIFRNDCLDHVIPSSHQVFLAVETLPEP